MVYCPRCGAENEDTAVKCSSCGEPLRRVQTRTYRRYREDDLCFDSRRGFSWFGIFLGVIIIFAGAVLMFEGQYWWASWDNIWPVVVILFGLLIVFNTLSRRL
jgi:uncharacterized membrane protein YvbJ